MKKYQSIIFVGTVAVALTLGSGIALAQKDQSSMTIIETIKALQSQGYTDFDSIEREWDHYDVEAVNDKGERVELKVDKNTGKVLRSELD